MQHTKNIYGDGLPAKICIKCISRGPLHPVTGRAMETSGPNQYAFVSEYTFVLLYGGDRNIERMPDGFVPPEQLPEGDNLPDGDASGQSTEADGIAKGDKMSALSAAVSNKDHRAIGDALKPLGANAPRNKKDRRAAAVSLLNDR